MTVVALVVMTMFILDPLMGVTVIIAMHLSIMPVMMLMRYVAPTRSPVKECQGKYSN
jgi:hypothetical protein